MDSLLRTLFCLTILLTGWVTHTKAECDIGETEELGKCFYSSNIARNLVLDFWWVYPDVNQVLSPSLEQHLLDTLMAKMEQFNVLAKNMGLERHFCPEDDCSLVDITVSDFGSGDILAQFYIENVYRLLSEVSSQSSLTVNFLQTKFNNGFFNLLADSELENPVSAIRYNLTWTFYCAPGIELIPLSQYVWLCGTCVEGQYSNSSSGGICTPCARGEYATSHGSTACTPCPEGYTTAEEGAEGQEQCQEIVICPPGYYVRSRVCSICSYGLYQPDTGSQSQCLSCAPNQITYAQGSTDEDQCFDECPPGYSLSEAGDCSICPLGTYLNYPRTQRDCIPCPNNLTTDGAGSDDVTLCRNIICAAGYIREGSDPGQCAPCPEHTYRAEDMSLCTSCGDVTRWRTDVTGAASKDRCQFFCPGGMYINGDSCSDCPQDTYKGETEYYATGCQICPSNSPKTEAARATSIDHCKYARCSRGQEISLANTLLCVDCDYGFYQMAEEPIGQRCIGCPGGQSTVDRASTSPNDCKEYCLSGYEVSPSGCSPCPVGTYKSNADGLFSMCQSCPLDRVTVNTASTSRDDCSVLNCSAGYRINESTDVCEKCPRGTYQDQRYQTQCKACPDPESTTAQEGTTSEADCNVYLFVTRIAFKITFDLDWNDLYWDHDSAAYGAMETRILRHVDRTQGSVAAYRGGLTLITLVEGSVSAHMIAKFFKNDPNLHTDFARVMDDAISSGRVSDSSVDGYLPLPVDNRQPRVFEYAEKSDGDPDVCPYGYYYDYSSAICDKCPIGMYQPQDIGDVCLGCPAHYSTSSSGKFGAQEDVCLLICEPGFEAFNGDCVQCPLGSYKAAQSVFECALCGSGQTTSTLGATSTDQCLAQCPAGQYSTPSKQCSRCPLDQYNPLPNQQACLSCPLNLKTTVRGAVSQDQCKDQCEIDEPCLHGGTCRWSSTENTYSCLCPPEYLGDICETALDICSMQRPCLNSGSCIVQSATSYRCACTQEYEGELCETKVQATVAPTEEPGTSSVTYIAIGASVGALALVAVAVILIIWCRRRRPRPQKKPRLPVLNGNTLTNNNNTISSTNSMYELSNPGITPHSTIPKSFAPVPPPPPPTSTIPPPPTALASSSDEFAPPVPPKSPGLARRETGNGKNITMVAMSNSSEKISQRASSLHPPESQRASTLHPPESPTSKRNREREDKRRASEGRKEHASSRLRRSEVPEETPFSMPPMSNPLLEPPVDYPFDPPTEPRDESVTMQWEEAGLRPPPYSKKDPSNKKKNKRIKAAKSGKKKVTIDTDRNLVHNMSVRSTASSSHTYMDLDVHQMNRSAGSTGGQEAQPASYHNPGYPSHGQVTRINPHPHFEQLN